MLTDHTTQPYSCTDHTTQVSLRRGRRRRISRQEKRMRSLQMTAGTATMQAATRKRPKPSRQAAPAGGQAVRL
jgi:hypothetical protein